MDTISWEKDANGRSANTKQSKESKFLSPLASASLVEGLMHEVTTISASFSNDNVIVLSRLAGISVIDEKTATFYGLYESSGVDDGPNYCLRRCLWKRGFGSIKEVLDGLDSLTLFFDFHDLSSDLREVVALADSPSKDEYEIFSQPSSDACFTDKKIRYFVLDDSKDVFCGYLAKLSSNPSIEKLFLGLEALFDSLMLRDAISPVAGSFRISYKFQNLSEILARK